MTMLQNQAPKELPNVLHDEGVPNALAGVRLPASAFPLRGLTIATIVGVLAVLLVLLALALARTA